MTQITTATVIATRSTNTVERAHSLCLRLRLRLRLSVLFMLACGSSPTSEPGPQEPSLHPEQAPEPTPKLAHKLAHKLTHKNSIDVATASPEASTHAENSSSTPPLAPEARPDAWPAELPWVSGPEPHLTSALASDAGDHVLTMNLGKGALDTFIAPWRQALAATGFQEQGSCTVDAEAMTFECVFRNEQRLALLFIGPERGDPKIDPLSLRLHALPPGHRPTQRLPGPCVVPPTRERLVRVDSSGIDQLGEFRQASQEWLIRTMPHFDLDGDGTSDVLVPAKAPKSKRSRDQCPWQIPMDVYLMRGECGHKIGTIVGDLDIQTNTAPFVAGIRQLSTFSEWADYSDVATGTYDHRGTRKKKPTKSRMGGIPVRHQRERRYRFNGTKLRMKTDHDSVAQCHHCGVSHCTTI